MLFLILFTSIVNPAVRGEDKPKVLKQYTVLPFPLELPNRNDRAEQCWLRVEDAELIETVTVYCHIAQAFLNNFIRDYNTRKMMEDNVDVSLWSEDPRPIDNSLMPNKSESGIVDWKLTTVMDPTTKRRLYITKNAECKLIMYSREGMTSYEVDCEKVLFFINVHINRAMGTKFSVITLLIALIHLFVYV